MSEATTGFLLLHGIAMHAGPYQSGLQRMSEGLAQPLAIDLPGHGDTPGSTTGRQLDLCFQNVSEHLNRKGIRRVVVTAESLGCAHVGKLTEHLRADSFEISGHILFAPPIQLNLHTVARWTGKALSLRQLPKLALGQVDLRPALMDLVASEAWEERLLDDPLVKTSASLAYVVRSTLAFLSVTKSIGKLSARTLLMQGECDVLMGKRNLAIARRHIVTSELVEKVILGAGHALFWDPHTDEVVSTVRTWLKTTL